MAIHDTVASIITLANCAKVVTEIVSEIVGNEVSNKMGDQPLTEEVITDLVIASINNELGV